MTSDQQDRCASSIDLAFAGRCFRIEVGLFAGLECVGRNDRCLENRGSQSRNRLTSCKPGQNNESLSARPAYSFKSPRSHSAGRSAPPGKQACGCKPRSSGSMSPIAIAMGSVAQGPPYGPAALPAARALAAPPNARRGGKAARLESEPCATVLQWRDFPAPIAVGHNLSARTVLSTRGDDFGQ